MDRGNFTYDWRENYKVSQMLKDDIGGTLMAKIKKWETSQGI